MKILIYLMSLSLVLFVSCSSGNNFSNEEKLQYTKMGNKVVKQSFDTLRNSLQTAIAEMGIENAVSYCNLNAINLTDTYASDSVLISRTSLKYRNPANKPDTAEERILNFFASQIEKGIQNDSLHPLVEKEKNGSIHFYKPIILQATCTSCHGTKIEVAQSELWKRIDSLYPSDRAYGFNPGDFRGMWHVKFAKK